MSEKKVKKTKSNQYQHFQQVTTEPHADTSYSSYSIFQLKRDQRKDPLGKRDT